MIDEVTGPRKLGNGLAVPGKFTASTKSAAIGQKLKEKIMHMEMETTIRNCSATRIVQLELKRLEIK